MKVGASHGVRASIREEAILTDDTGTVFKRVDYKLADLLTYIDMGDLDLPDIQRPFVWRAAKVRDLIDSMYRGFPVGYLLFWAGTDATGEHTLVAGGTDHDVPALLIIDGQQRLTGLYAVLRGMPIRTKDYALKTIEIAFRPRDGRLEVADAAIRKDPEFIPNISTLWTSGKPSFSLVNEFLARLGEKRTVSAEEGETIGRNIERLYGIQHFPFTALEIDGSVDEEHAAEIFVRTNSEGVTLNQADFILTLLSVFWDEGRAALETFSRESRAVPQPGMSSPFNHYIKPGPDQLLRVGVALGFRRAQLKAVYQVLRGKDPETGLPSPELREKQFDRLKGAQGKVLNLNYWHQFFHALLGAGFRSGQLVSSEIALLYAYVFYLLGRVDYGLDLHRLDRLIGRWFYMSTLTGRYSGSPETVMDQDLNRVKGLQSASEFETVLNEVIDSALTSDFWATTLPSQMSTSSARSPQFFAFVAAQIRLNAPVLFSERKISDLLDPAIQPVKTPLDRHHLFPRGWLESQGESDLKVINQLANFTLLEWPENISISDSPPYEYLPTAHANFASQPENWERMCELHALPDGWQDMAYADFLHERRHLMSAVIRSGFETLA